MFSHSTNKFLSLLFVIQKEEEVTQMKIGLFGNKFSEELLPALQKLVDYLNASGVQISVYNSFYKKIRQHLTFGQEPAIFSKTEDIAGKLDFLISLGGDGTLLRTITVIRDSGIPVLGINMGHLGFLTSIGKNNIPDFVADLVAGKYSIETRSLLNLKSEKNLFGNENFALNELSIHRFDSFSMLSVDVFVNEYYLTTYTGDGLIVATPTGSTAYSLSCGGPILSPDSNSFVITPISPHALTFRPIIVSDTSVIKLRLIHDHSDICACLDSRREIISDKAELIIRKEDFSIKLVRMMEQNFFSSIREKLMWGGCKRDL